jgi:hypothetical protein
MENYEKSFKIKLTKAINFKNHKQLCRLCLNKFEEKQKRVKISRNIENQYFMLTQFDVSIIKANY